MVKEDIAMQTRCVSCKREQYAMAVYSISRGEHPCVWCGVMGRKMSKEQYRNAMKGDASV